MTVTLSQSGTNLFPFIDGDLWSFDAGDNDIRVEFINTTNDSQISLQFQQKVPKRMSPVNNSIETSEPYDGGPYQTESGWTTTFSLALSNGCIDRGNGLQVYSSEDGRQVKVRAGRYFIRGHIYILASEKVLAVPATTSP